MEKGQQLPLFEIAEVTKTFFDMSEDSIDEAASIMVGLLGLGSDDDVEGGQRRDQVTFEEVALKKMGLSVPPSTSDRDMSRLYLNQYAALVEQRVRIGFRSMSQTGKRLVAVDEFGRPATQSGGKPPIGYAIDAGGIGESNGQQRAKMAVGALRGAIRTSLAAGRITDEQAQEGQKQLAATRELLGLPEVAEKKVIEAQSAESEPQP